MTKRNRLNPHKYMVAYTYSYVWNNFRWRVWRPYQHVAVIPTFSSLYEAHAWVATQAV